MSKNETALFNLSFEIFPSVNFGSHFKTVVQCLGVDVVLDIVEQFLYISFDTLDCYSFFFERIAAHHFDSAIFNVASTKHEAYRHTLEFVVSEFKARALVVGVVVLHRNTLLFQVFYDRSHLGVDGVELLLATIDRHNHHLNWSQLWRKHQTVVVAVGHDKRTHQASGNTPRCSPNVIELVFIVDKFHIKCLCEVLTQEVRCTTLQSLAILHHSFDGVGFECASKAFVSSLYTLHYRHCHIFFCEIGIYIQHFDSLSLSFFLGGVGCVAFLPKEFCCAEEQACAHFPAEHVCPLVHEQWEVAI